MNIESLTPKQRRCIAESNARLNFAWGAVRSGKSVAIEQVRWPQFVQTSPSGDLLMIGKTLGALERNVLRPLRSEYGSSFVDYSTSNKKAKIFGREVDLEGANDEAAYKKIQGMTAAGILINELTLVPKSMFTQCLSRLSVKDAKLFATMNPESPNNYVKTDYIDRASELDLRHWKFHIEENYHLSQDYVDSLKKEYTGLWYRRYILGEWCLAEGLVYDMFNPDVHVVTDLPKIQRYIIGVDYGTNNPTAFILIGQAEDGRFYAVKEYYHDGGNTTQKTDSEYAKDLKAFLPRNYLNIVIDPSAKSFILACKRIGIENIRKADNAVIDGIRSVSSLLSNNFLFYHKSCKNLINEKQAYSWDIKAQERGEDKPNKAHDHVCDSERYTLHSNYRLWKSILERQTKAVDRLEGATIN